MQAQASPFDDIFHHVASPSFILNLHILTALLFLSLLVSVASLAVPTALDEAWLCDPAALDPRLDRLVHRVHGLGDSLHLGHAGIWLERIWVTRGFGSSGTGLIQNPFAYRILIFYPLWLGAWTMAIATLVAPSTLSVPQKHINVVRYPMFFNTFAIGVPLVFLATLLPYAVMGSHVADVSDAAYDAYKAALARSPVDMGALMTATSLIESTQVQYGYYWGTSWALYGTFLIVSTLVFLGGSVIYFRILVQSMRTIRDQQPGRSSSKLKFLTSAYASLITTSITTLLIEGIYAALALVTATQYATISKSAKSDVLSLASTYFYAIVGGVTNIVILFRSVQIYHASLTPSISSTTGNDSTGMSGTSRLFGMSKLQASTTAGTQSSSGVVITCERKVKFDSEYSAFDMDWKELGEQVSLAGGCNQAHSV